VLHVPDDHGELYGAGRTGEAARSPPQLGDYVRSLHQLKYQMLSMGRPTPACNIQVRE
jgi:hypothetical protein